MNYPYFVFLGQYGFIKSQRLLKFFVRVKLLNSISFKIIRLILGNRDLSPAYPPPELFVAPQFDEFGAPLPPEDLEYDYNDDIFDEVIEIPEPRPRIPRPPNSNLGPDLQPRLPNFDILHATEVLRGRDQNQKSIVNPGAVNAGILPLAFENPEGLGLFPPLVKP